MKQEQVIIVGGGPCGMSCAIALQKRGLQPLIIEKGNIVNTIYQFPTHQMFFSSSEKLEIGDTAFITEKQKPVRNQALAYYRSVAERQNLRINTFETVTTVEQINQTFQVTTKNNNHDIQTYSAEHIIIATGYYDQPNYMNIPGEDLPNVMHYFKEAHPYYNKDVVVIGGKNSAVDATLELHKAGARITVLYRGSEYSKSIKPWILPEFDALIRKGIVHMEFNAEVNEITKNEVHYTTGDYNKIVHSDFVFAMTGYKPDLAFLETIGVNINKLNGKPDFSETSMETNIPGVYIAGVVAAGYNNNEIFIENGRFHGEMIATSIKSKT